jgi:hypothetical protein
MTDCQFSQRCQLPWPELEGTDWAGVRHCKNCNRPVFLASTRQDAGALGRIGHCVQLGAPPSSPEFFIGIIVEPRAEDTFRNVKVSMLVCILNPDLPDSDLALRGFTMYFQQLKNFDRSLIELRSTGRVVLESVPILELAVWSRRLAEWNLTANRYSEA